MKRSCVRELTTWHVMRRDLGNFRKAASWDQAKAELGISAQLPVSLLSSISHSSIRNYSSLWRNQGWRGGVWGVNTDVLLPYFPSQEMSLGTPPPTSSPLPSTLLPCFPNTPGFTIDAIVNQREAGQHYIRKIRFLPSRSCSPISNYTSPLWMLPVSLTGGSAFIPKPQSSARHSGQKYSHPSLILISNISSHVFWDGSWVLCDESKCQ